METRGYDVFSVPVGNGSGPGTLSSFCRPFRQSLSGKCSRLFNLFPKNMQRIHGYQIAVNLDEIMDTGLPKKNLLDIDYSCEVGDEGHGLQFLDGFGKRGPPDRYYT